MTPPRWLVPDWHARRFGLVMAIAMVAGFVLASRLALRAGGPAAAGMMGFLLVGPLVVVLAGSAAAAAAGRSFRSGLWACAWATVLGAPLVMATWLAEAPRWYRQVGGLLLDADGGGMGANLSDAIWWTLVMLVLWHCHSACSARPPGARERAAGALARRPAWSRHPERRQVERWSDHPCRRPVSTAATSRTWRVQVPSVAMPANDDRVGALVGS